MFKKPKDPYEGKSKKELEEIADEFGKHEFSKEEERAMISAALMTFLPVVLAVFAIFAIIVWLVWMFLS
ncbi:MAG: hypothetical protein GXY89_09580 [Tissierellia bacterium]|jgi:hypothetical protein|nr:hypothetical protein [Tissierellia bacterium]